MDQPGLEVRKHEHALRGLARINLLSLAGKRVWKRVEELFREKGAPLRVLDVACGGGDIAITVKRKAEKAGIPLDMEGCDVSPTALDHAKARAEEAGFGLRFFEHDVTKDGLPSGYDLTYSSLFLHHLSDAEAIRFLQALSRSGRSFLVQDLLRTRAGYCLAVWAGTVLTRSKVVRLDSRRSVCAAYSLSEVRDLVEAAGLGGAGINRCWPERFTIDWRLV